MIRLIIIYKVLLASSINFYGIIYACERCTMICWLFCTNLGKNSVISWTRICLRLSDFKVKGWLELENNSPNIRYESVCNFNFALNRSASMLRVRLKSIYIIVSVIHSNTPSKPFTPLWAIAFSTVCVSLALLLLILLIWTWWQFAS